MDYLHDELIAPFVIRDRLNAANTQRLLAAVRAASDCGCGSHARRPLGRWLVRAGRWLDARADPCRRAIRWGVVADPCHGCAN